MEDLFGAVVVIIGIIASIISSAKKEKEKKAAMEKHKAAAVARVEAAQKQKAAAAAAKPVTAQPLPIADAPFSSAVPIPAAAPTVHPHIEPDCETHDQPGSLGATTMEGKDPCHEDELTLERTFAEVIEPEGGLTFDWTGDSMVKAFVMQEVLTRPINRAAARQQQAR